MKKLYIILLCYLTFFSVSKAQDSLYFYKTGNIEFRASLSQIDSVSLLAPDYYLKYRSGIVYNDLKSTPELTRFAEMIKIAGYEQKLDDVTVWAPTNSALARINLQDTLLVKRIVSNHLSPLHNIAYFDQDRRLIMASNKRINIQKRDGIYTFGGVPVANSNIFSAQSVIHVLNGYVPYKKNIWEYITEGEGYNSLKNCLKTIHSNDSAFFATTFGFMMNEDSVYTAVIPTDEAWIMAYNKLFPYCKSPSNGTDLATQKNILQRLFYKGRISSSDSSAVASIFGYTMNSPRVLLEGSQTEEMSNGNCLPINYLKMFSDEYWSKTIKIEAEDKRYGVTKNTMDLSICSNNNPGYDISNQQYLKVTPNKTVSLVKYWVNFPIPNTLSTKYNVYCVIIPAVIDSAADTRPNKVTFSISYTDASGNQVYDAPVDANNNLMKSGTANTFITNGTTVQKMLVVKEMELPFCNPWFCNPSLNTFSVKVQSVARDTEKATYNRTLRIDYIILEPVQ